MGQSTSQPNDLDGDGCVALGILSLVAIDAP